MPGIRTAHKKGVVGTSRPVQWLRLLAANVGGTGSTPGQGTKIPHAVWLSQKIKKKKRDVVSPAIYN